MPANKTMPTPIDVDSFMAAIDNPVRRADAELLRERMERITGDKATMWGPSIIGFGSYHYRYESGREGTSCRVGFSPRAARLVLYVADFPGIQELIGRLGKHKRSVGCVYVNRLSDIDLAVLDDIIAGGYRANAAP